MRVIVVVKDRRGFLIENATVSVAARRVLNGAGTTDENGRAALRLRVGRLPARGAVIARVSAAKPGDPAVGATKAVRLGVLR